MNLSLLYSPRRLSQRIAFGWYRRTNPGIPLLAIQAVEFLAEYLRPTNVLLRIRRIRIGDSTRRYANKCKHVTAVENMPEWGELTDSPTPEIRWFVLATSGWRRVNFTDGVHRTAVLFSPEPRAA